MEDSVSWSFVKYLDANLPMLDLTRTQLSESARSSFQRNPISAAFIKQHDCTLTEQSFSHEFHTQNLQIRH
jgi:hypothetical protein